MITGFIVAALAKLIMSGREAGGIDVAMLLGIAWLLAGGSWPRVISVYGLNERADPSSQSSERFYSTALAIPNCSERTSLYNGLG
jgi:hypothetical protein